MTMASWIRKEVANHPEYKLVNFIWINYSVNELNVFHSIFNQQERFGSFWSHQLRFVEENSRNSRWQTKLCWITRYATLTIKAKKSVTKFKFIISQIYCYQIVKNEHYLSGLFNCVFVYWWHYNFDSRPITFNGNKQDNICSEFIHLSHSNSE